MIINDKLAEPTETVTVTITSATGAPVADGTGVVTIVDNASALTASAVASHPATGSSLDAARISAALAGARAIWAGEGFDTGGLESVSVQLVDFPDATLGEADGDTIRLRGEPLVGTDYPGRLATFATSAQRLSMSSKR